MSVSNNDTVTDHILPCILYVGNGVNQYIHRGKTRGQKVYDNNKLKETWRLCKYAIKDQLGGGAVGGNDC